MLARFSARPLLQNFHRPVKFCTRGFAAVRLRDENAPKRPLSAYNIFTKEKASELQQLSAEKLTAPGIIRRCAAEWKAMNPEQKQFYHDQVVGKEEYINQKAAYKQSDEYAEFIKKKTQAAKREKLKEFELLDAPKRPRSAYIYFGNDRREQVKAANPFAPITQVMKLLGAAWKELPEGEKAVYERQAQDDKTRYASEVAQHQESAEYREMQSKKEEYLSTLKKKKPTRKKIDEKAKERKKKMTEKVKARKSKEREKKKLDNAKRKESLAKMVEKKRKEKEAEQLKRAMAKAKIAEKAEKARKEKEKLEAKKKELKIKLDARKEKEKLAKEKKNELVAKAIAKANAANAKAKAKAKESNEKAKLMEKARKLVEKAKKTGVTKKRATAAK